MPQKFVVTDAHLMDLLGAGLGGVGTGSGLGGAGTGAGLGGVAGVGPGAVYPGTGGEKWNCRKYLFFSFFFYHFQLNVKIMTLL